jgi:hypothetical protein
VWGVVYCTGTCLAFSLLFNFSRFDFSKSKSKEAPPPPPPPALGKKLKVSFYLYFLHNNIITVLR